MRPLFCILIAFISFLSVTNAQSKKAIDRQQFFLDDRVIETTFSTDIKNLRTDKKVPKWQPAKITMQFSDTLSITEDINVEPRGIYRKNNCDMASLMLNFKNEGSPKLSALKKLKLVGGCRSNKADEELLLKEYLVYKIYNFLSVMSFRVRLLHVNYVDSKDKAKSYSQYAFLIEDMGDLAKRNNCMEKKNKEIGLDAADRTQFNLVCIFQYMIGNTDWSVRKYHNIKLMVAKNDTLSDPYVIPYDFDYAGLVNAPYAVPNEELGITSVTERLYRGFIRTMDEIQPNLDIFKEKKSVIMTYLNDFPYVNSRTKKEMTNYLEEFYDVIDKKSSAKNVFVDNARHD